METVLLLIIFVDIYNNKNLFRSKLLSEKKGKKKAHFTMKIFHNE